MAKNEVPATSKEFTKGRRQRAVIVCANCRRRKIKCDKGNPCSNCIKNGCPTSCAYDSTMLKADDQYTKELQFDYSVSNFNNRDYSIENGKRSVGEFLQWEANPSKSEGQLIRKRPKTGDHVAASSEDGHAQQKPSESQPTAPDKQKSEIQFLKTRLDEIEKSLLSSKSTTSEFFQTPPTAYTLTDAVQLENPANVRLSESSKPNHANNSPKIWQRPSTIPYMQQVPICTPDNLGRHFASVLPPLSASFKHESGYLPSFRSNELETLRTTTVPAMLEPNIKLDGPGNQGVGFPWKFSLQKKNKLLVGTNIIGDISDTINLYEQYSSLHQKDDLRRINFGPYAWSSLMRRDKGLNLVWEQIKSKKESSFASVFANMTTEITPENTNAILNNEKDTDQHERQFEKRALETDGIDEIIPYSSIMKARKERNLQRKPLNSTRLSLGLTYYDIQIDRELDTIEKVKTVLPTKSIIWKLIKHFFDSVYVYMPYLDEGYFRDDICRIIGPESHDESPVSELKIERKLDLAVVGILLTILRLSYISLLSNNTLLTERTLKSADPSPEIQKMRYLLNNPISIDTINVATLCFDQFEFMRRANFTVLQLAVYLRIYHTYAPEDGDGADGGGSQLLGSVMLSMSCQLGLNREPDQTCTNLRMNNLSRKIWYLVCLSDIHLASCFGNPQSIDERYYDTKPPFYVSGGENLIDKAQDKTTMDRYIECGDVFFTLKDLLREVLDIRHSVSLSRITSMLTTLENNWYQHCGSLQDCLQFKKPEKTAILDRNFRIKMYIFFRCFVMTTCFHIYLHYEPKDTDLSFFYFKKCLLISTADVMPHYSALLGNSEVVSDMIINPTLEMFVHKSNMVYLSGIIRANTAIYHLRESKGQDHVFESKSSDSAYLQKLCQLSSCLARAAEYTILAINKISHRYYYAWRITKSQTVLLKAITSTEFYKANYDPASNSCHMRFSESQLDELIQICEATLSELRNSEQENFGFTQGVDSHVSGIFSEQIVSNPLSPSNVVNDCETDKLWLQILSWKHDLPGEFQNDSQHANKLETCIQQGNTQPNIDEKPRIDETPTFGEPPNGSELDIFSDILFNDEFYI